MPGRGRIAPAPDPSRPFWGMPRLLGEAAFSNLSGSSPEDAAAEISGVLLRYGPEPRRVAQARAALFILRNKDAGRQVAPPLEQVLSG